MGTVGNQNPWAPYESYRDCSQTVCTPYCPQWCYLFPPPPPLELEDDSENTFSPLIIAIISILASAFLLVTYYTIITKYCRRRRLLRGLNSRSGMNLDQITPDQLQTAVTGLDESLIKSITVCKYIKGDGLIEGTECAVCLNEFQENESLRLLPKCTHAFHLPCIDAWLKTHSNCPLCRSSASPTPPSHPPPPPPPPAPTFTHTSSTVNVSSLETQQQNDLVLVVENRDEVVVSFVADCPPKDNTMENAEIRNNEPGNEQVRDQNCRRSMSMSLDRFPVSIADILGISEDEQQLQTGIGSSRDYPGEQSKPGIGMNRSVSTGRFILTHGKGKNSIASN